MLSEIIPEKVTMEVLHSVLKLLLSEGVSIRNIPLILEAIGEVRGSRVELVNEHVRKRLGGQITSRYKSDDGTLALVQLAVEWDDVFGEVDELNAINGHFESERVALPSAVFARLSENVSNVVSRVSDRGVKAVLVVSSARRRYVRALLKAKGVDIPVLSYDELDVDCVPLHVGLVAA